MAPTFGAYIGLTGSGDGGKATVRENLAAEIAQHIAYLKELIGEYRAAIVEVLGGLSAERLPQALDIARIPEDIRGYGHVKQRHLAAVRPKCQALMQRWRAGALRQTPRCRRAHA